MGAPIKRAKIFFEFEFISIHILIVSGFPENIEHALCAWTLSA
jgi:hypothetical protein